MPLERWPSAQGSQADAVLGWQSAGRLHFQFPGFARYVFDVAGCVCSAYAFAGASDRQVIDTYQRAVLPIILQSRGIEVLHASAIDTDAGVIAFAARSGTGKSTLAAQFQSEGYGVWADDAVTWAVEGDAVVTAPLPFVLRVGEGKRAYVSLPTDGLRAARPLAAVIVMERCTDAAPSLGRITLSSEVLPLVLPHAYCFSTRESAANRSLISNYLSLVAKLQLHRLRFPADIQLLPAVTRLIEAALQVRPC